METTSFQREWQQIADRWGLNVEVPFAINVGGTTVTVPFLLRDFGGPRGILLVTDFEAISPYADGLIALGFGFSTLSEQGRESQAIANETIVEMLSDWGWSGHGSPPSWYCDASS